jgi:hypothetical protein
MKTKLTVEFSNASELLVELCNELKIGDDGWAMLAPMGDHPGMALVDDGKGGLKKIRAIQRLDKQALTTMANEFEKSTKGAKRYLAGRPIYVGHPDVPGMSKKYPDGSIKGMFSNVAVREGEAPGLYGLPVFTAEGSDLVENKKYRALSGRWNADPAGEENATPIFRPTVLLSAGLTNQPNLPVQLLNEKDDDTRPAPDPNAGPSGEGKGKVNDDDADPANRAFNLSKAAHKSSNKAHELSLKAYTSGMANDHTAAFRGHSDAAASHMEAANGYDGDAAADHNELAESHQAKAMQHLKAAKKMGSETKAESANEKDKKLQAAMIEAVKDDVKASATHYLRRGDLLGVNATLINERDTAKGEQTAMKTERDNAKSALATAEAAATSAKSELANTKTQLETKTTEFGNERTKMRDWILGQSVMYGKITQAERKEYERRMGLDGQFWNEVQALAGIKASKVKVAAITMDRGGDKVILESAGEKRSMQKKIMTEIANELHMDERKNYDAIFREAIKRHPLLFGADNHPAMRK